MKIAFIDPLGLVYDGDTLSKRGLGGSEYAVVMMSRELQKIGFEVTVFNNCNDETSSSGIYDNVRYVDHSEADFSERFDITIVSRTTIPFLEPQRYHHMVMASKYRVMWLHDTFAWGDESIPNLLETGVIHQLFTLSDFHTVYTTTSDHFNIKRMFEVMKPYIFQTRNGATKHIDEVDISQKDKNHFVYASAVTKGLNPLLQLIWPKVKEKIPDARLTVVGGFYKFSDKAEPDKQEQDLIRYQKEFENSNLDVSFTGVVSQQKVAETIANATFMLYPTEYPETFGISTLESLLYKTPVITNNFGALEETAIDLACYKTDYPIVPNGLFPYINAEEQSKKFVDLVLEAYHNDYLLMQKQNYCDVVNDIYSWSTIALQWKQHFYRKVEDYLPKIDFQKVNKINKDVARIYGRKFVNEDDLIVHPKIGTERRIIVVSPFRNANDYVYTHCKSVEQQDYSNYIHVLIDDASEDTPIIPENKNRAVIRNSKREGCIANQLKAISKFVKKDDIVMFLDGDDFLVSNNTLFDYYNRLYDEGYEFTYGSMWSLADEIPLVAQDYPKKVKENKTYREHLFNWKIPYTHLRTVKGEYCLELNEEVFKENGNFLMSGMDNPLFYELIEKVPHEKVKAVKEIVCYYNDINPLNDYKVNTIEQNKNASISYKKDSELKKILIAIPTNKNIESDTFKSIYDLKIPDGYKTQLEFFYGYQVDQIRNLIAEWGKNYDFVLHVDSDIVLPNDTLQRLISYDKDIVSGVYVQRNDENRPEIFLDNPQTGGLDHAILDGLPHGLVQVGGCGFGCVLVKGEVYRALEYPHFLYKSAIDHKNTISEDTYFCQKARAAGFEVWADTSLMCDHIGQRVFRPTKSYK